MEVAASAMAASLGSQRNAPSYSQVHSQAHAFSAPWQNHRRQGFPGSKCGVLQGDSDFLYDTALAATAAAAAVLPVYWLYVHSGKKLPNSTASLPKAPVLPVNSSRVELKGGNERIQEISGSLGLSGIECPSSAVQTQVSEDHGESRRSSEVWIVSTAAEREQASKNAYGSSISEATGLSHIQKGHEDISHHQQRHGPDLPLNQDLAQAIDMFHRRRQEIKQDLGLYDKLIRAGRIKESLEILESMEKKETLDMDKIHHATFFQQCRNQLAVEEAFTFVRLVPSPTRATFNMLVSVCCAAADVEGAFGAFFALKQAGIQPDCKIYTTLISTCAKAVKLDLLFQAFEEMHTVGIQPDVLTYGAVIDGCARAGDMANAFRVYRLMIMKDVKPDQAIFNSLIHACGRSGAIERAFEVFTELVSDKLPVEPNQITMSTLIEACSRAGQVEPAYEVYRMMRQRGLGRTSWPYTSAVHACSHNGDLGRAFSIYNDMKNDGIKPNEVFFSALIDVAGHAGNVDAAFKILEEAEKYSIIPGTVTFNSLMGVCSNTGNWEKALKLYESIRALGIQPDVSTLNALVSALCRGTRLQTALQILAEFKAAGIFPDQRTYRNLLEACEKGNEVKVALDLYVTAMAEGIDPDMSIAESMIGVCFLGIRDSTSPHRLASSVNPSWATGNKEKPRDQWLSWALPIYRQIISRGMKPSALLICRVLGCLRLPEKHTGNSHMSLLQQVNSPSWNWMEGFGVYDPRALAIYEEASTFGVTPAFRCDSPITIDADSMPQFTTEVCLLTVLKALRHRYTTDGELPPIIITLSSQRKSVILRDGRVKGITVTSRNGDSVAVLLRRLRLRYIGKESSGTIRVTPAALLQWFRPQTSATAQVDTKTLRPTILGKSIAEQQSAIRMGTALPPMDSQPRRRSSFNRQMVNFRHHHHYHHHQQQQQDQEQLQNQQEQQEQQREPQ